MKNELTRKIIHFSFSIVPLSYFLIDKEILIIFLLFSSLSLILIDIGRVYLKGLNLLFLKIFKSILRKHELETKKFTFTGGTYIVLSALICILIFPKIIAILSLLIVIYCDTFAAIVGKKFGKHFIFNKTFEGSVAFFVTGLIICLVIPLETHNIYEYFSRLIALFLTTILEVLPYKIDDNLVIPIFFGILNILFLKILI